MIRESLTDHDNRVTRIEVLSNLSLTLDSLAFVFLGLSAVTLTVALLPTLLGYWPIMAIAIVHLLVVGWCFRIAWRGHWARQDITVDCDIVQVDLRTAKGLQRQRLAASWAKVEKRFVRGEPRVFVALHGTQIEIGSFVPAEERIEAANSITRALEPFSAWNTKRIKETASSA